MSELLLIPKDYSVNNHYTYYSKPRIETLLDFLTLPLRIALGGKGDILLKKDLTWIKESSFIDVGYTPSCILRVSALALSLLFYRVTLVSALLLGIKYLVCNEAWYTIPNAHHDLPDSPILVKTKIKETISCSDYEIEIYPLNKLYVYNAQIVKNSKIEDKITYSVHEIENKSNLEKMKIFSANKMEIVKREGVFRFDETTEKESHWTVDFADDDLFGFCFMGQLAQEELLCLEHPGLYHLRKALVAKQHNELKDDEIALVRGVKRYSALDTSKKGVDGKTLYGNNFRDAIKEQIDSCLTIFDDPKESQIVAMVAPRKGLYSGPTYDKDDLEKYFYRAYAAFSASKGNSNGKKAVIHTGNWGCGSFGNSYHVAALTQLVAARIAQVDQFIYYPMDHVKEFEEAVTLLQKIEKENPNFTVEEFLTHLHENAKNYGLVYGTSNGT